MRKIGMVLAIILSLICFSGCNDNNSKKDDKINIVTSFYPMYIATINITDGIEDVEVTNLTASTTGCLHDYQITTADMLKLSNADILIINGDGMESFIEKAISTYPDVKIINASEGIRESHEELLDEESGEHVNEEHEHGLNSHYWVSPTLYIEQIKNIEEKLVEIDSNNKEKYELNANTYIEKIDALRNEMHEELDGKEKRNIVTFHEAFDFFAEEFELKVVAVVEREPGTTPSSKEVAQIIDMINEKDVQAIFVEPQYSRSAADTIARETNVKVYNLDPVVTGEMDKDAYIRIMKENLEVLKEALN